MACEKGQGMARGLSLRGRTTWPKCSGASTPTRLLEPPPKFALSPGSPGERVGAGPESFFTPLHS